MPVTIRARPPRGTTVVGVRDVESGEPLSWRWDDLVVVIPAEVELFAMVAIELSAEDAAS